jgi:hypothetical protein
MQIQPGRRHRSMRIDVCAIHWDKTTTHFRSGYRGYGEQKESLRYAGIGKEGMEILRNNENMKEYKAQHQKLS